MAAVEVVAEAPEPAGAVPSSARQHAPIVRGSRIYTGRSMALYADLFRYPDLFGNLFRRELNVRYRGSLLGLGWTFVNPLALMAVYTLVFSVLWRTTTIHHYALFVISGLAIWTFFSSALSMASSSLLGHANLLKQVKFPRQLLPLAVVGANFVTYAVMVVVVGIINLFVIPSTRDTMWAVIPLSLPLVGLVSGLAIVFASLTVLYRDIEHLLLTALLPWFFLTPVLYELSQLPGVEAHHTWTELLRWGNFVTPFVEGIRGPLFHGVYPSVSQVVYMVCAALASLALGAFVFRRLDDQLAIEL
jgi:ABC-type polysaccharide/polyol phosphate export permease